ncbi:hypothetical protein KY334_01990, partial [Candidatus Woesearchaeota archaeon]|nr:hypothetical protein [Candidatus Woesearchaeota archaeon]
MKDIRIILITCTQCKDADEFSKTPLGKSAQKQHDIENVFGIIPFYNNKKGMPECYNNAIEQVIDPVNSFVPADYDRDVLLFVHDDVYITDIFL